MTEAERSMLVYALDLAQEKIWSEGGFSPEDQAAVTSLRRWASGCTCSPAGDFREEGPQQPDEDCLVHGDPRITEQKRARR